MLAEYYNNILYPLQDRITPLFKDSPFYLTGGTALSRGYYNHRYSDDLDYFVNDHPDFQRITERQIEKLEAVFEDIKKSLFDADSKAAGIAPLYVAKIFAEFDYTIADSEIKWTSPVPGETIRQYLAGISRAIVEGRL